MKDHFLIASLESGISLMAEFGHAEAVASLRSALASNLLSDIDVTSMSLPRGEAPLAQMPDNEFWPDPKSWFAAYRPYNVKKGVLYLPVRGVLLHGVGITFGRYFTGYEFIMRSLARARDDSEVHAITLVVDSNGGHVASCFDTADMIAGIGKPTMAIIADYGNSAGYALASACDTVVGTQTVCCGNIGVLRSHVDTTKMLDSVGIKYSYVTAPEGGDKAEGLPGVKTSADELARSQSDVNEMYEIFVKTVTKKRKISDESIRATKAHALQKEAALRLGLIDIVASSADMQMVSHEVFGGDSAKTSFHRIEAAATPATETKAEKEVGTMTDEEMKAEIEAKTKAARIEGETSARKRVADILSMPEAAGREALAKHLAFNTDMDADAAKAVLIVSPAVAAAPQGDSTTESQAKSKADQDALKKSFDEQMSRSAPNLSANKTGENEADPLEKSLAASKSLAARAGIEGYRSESRQ